MENQPNIRIALVEDHELIRNALSKMLAELPSFSFVFNAANGREFFDKLKDNTIDVVLLDLEMPIMNGIEVIEELKNIKSKIKVIVLTMYADLDMAFDVLSLGAHAFLLKESSTRELTCAIEQVFLGNDYTNSFMNKAVINNLAESRKAKTRAEHLKLDQRDLRLVKLICDGFSTKEIADLLPASRKNVDLLRTKLMKKFSVSSGNELIRVAILNNLYKPRTNREILLEIEDDSNAMTKRRIFKLKENHIKNFGKNDD
jgi:DNA-binding NarL/FixJ family response regulator